MNIDTWSVIFGYCGIKEIKNIIKICKKFNEIIHSYKYILFLSDEDKKNLLEIVSNTNIFYDNNICYNFLCFKEKMNITKILINMNDINYDIEYFIHLSACNNNIEFMKLLIKYHRDNQLGYEKYKFNPIHEAIINNGITIVKLLLEDGKVDPTFNNNYTLTWASSYNHIKIVKLLLKDSRVNPCDDNNNALKMAYIKNNKEIVRLLLKDPRVNINHKKNIKKLLDKNVTTCLNKFCYTHPSCFQKRMNNIKNTLNVYNCENYMHNAVCDNHIEIIKLLIKFYHENKLDYITHYDGCHNSVSEALICNNFKIVKLFLKDNKIDPIFNNNYVLMIASIYNQKEIVNILLKDSRIDPSINNNNAIKLAHMIGNKKIVKILLKDSRVKL